jgi:hypothetical protein
MKVLNLKILMKQTSPLAQQLFYLPFVKQFIFLEIYSNRKNTVLLNGMMLKMMLLNK